MSSSLSSHIKNLNGYKILCYATALLYFYLFLTLLFAPGSILDDFGIARAESADFLARRAAMLMLGFSVLSFLGGNAPHSAARQAILLAINVNMAGFAIMSSFEFLRGFANASILILAAVETILAAAYFRLWLSGRKQAMPAKGN